MFIKIIRANEEDRNSTRTYQCDSYIVEPVSGSLDEWTITLERYGSELAISTTYKITDTKLRIYVLNDQGKTIDTIFRSR